MNMPDVSNTSRLLPQPTLAELKAAAELVECINIALREADERRWRDAPWWRKALMTREVPARVPHLYAEVYRGALAAGWTPPEAVDA